jgi:hypothetical protein
LTEEVHGLFPRVPQKIEISVLGSQVVRGEFSLDGRPDSGENRQALAMSRIKGAKKVGSRSERRPRSWFGHCHGNPEMRKPLRKQGFAPEAIVTDKLRSYGTCHPGARSFSAA